MSLKFTIADKEYAVHSEDVTPETTLNEYLREKAHLMGTKRMCLEGGCGCCIVAVERIDPATKTKKIFTVNSCLVSVFSCQDWKINTIEGIGNSKIGYHPLQKTLADENGSQCGFCSGGMIMSMFAMINNGPVSAETVENSFGGNICRCTGYRAIIDSFKKFTTTDIKDIEDFKPCSPEECKNLCITPCHKLQKDLLYDWEKSKWMKVYSLQDLLQTISITTTNYRLVAGNTARGVYKHDPLPQTYLEVTSIKELTTWELVGNTLILGGNMSLNETLNIFNKVSTQNSKFKYLQKMARHIDLIANVPVRNVGTIAGNLMIKHTHQEFPSDIFLILETVGACLVITDVFGNENRVTPERFISFNMKKKVITKVILTGINYDYLLNTYKIMPRAQNVHAVVNAGFFFKMKSGVVDTCRIVYGGINPQFVHAIRIEKYLSGKSLFNNSVLQEAYKQLSNDLRPDYILPDDTPEYRKKLAIALFYKFVLNNAPSDKVSPKNKSGGSLLQRPLSSGVQSFSTNKNLYPVTAPLVKLEALSQTSGRAEYIEDMPDFPGQTFAQFVTAKVPPGSTITNIDASPALALPGVISFYGKNDIPGVNNWIPTLIWVYFTVKEELFCEGKVKYYDQPVGVIVAKTQDLANKAADLVKIICTSPRQEYYITVKDILKASKDVQKERITEMTTVIAKRKGNDVQKVVKGDFYIDLQYHFHMEVHCCNVIPVEDGLDVYSSTQWMDAVQIGIANVLGIKQTQVNMHVRRLGGAFGGKLVRNGIVGAATALAAFKTNRPTKLRLDLERNMNMIGKRNPLYVEYEVGVNNQGVIQYLDAELYSDVGVGGNEPLDPFIRDTFTSGYDTDTWNYTTHIVKTDTTPPCWTRSPGSSEGLAAIEAIMEHIATELGMDPLQLKRGNMIKEKHEKLAQFTNEMMIWANVDKRKQQIVQFNQDNRWRKRGISVVPMVWTYDVTANYTLHISIFHGDGSVAIAHGGVEMGQGINTKVVQVCAYKFGISMDLISIKPSNSLSNANSFGSGGSITSESVCWALIKACDELITRMKPIKDKMTNPTWFELIVKCHQEYVLLTTTSLYFPEPPQIVNYYIYGVATTEVEVDILTGQKLITNVHIIEDIGESMNPLIDIGQLEGAFIMGLGYHTTEKIIHGPQGQILTNRTWNYYPPGMKDIPVNFNIKFPENNPNQVGVLHSKAIAEPPFCLSISVPLAIRNAVGYARKESKGTADSWFKFDGCTNIEQTFLKSLNDFKQYIL
ncbi:uncharacterized protein LOC109604513 isoform X2 [Aethina tumida]|uniref:uncharacterized protein LOC109604513 isoform X2 n=1 Tax=Aethina tumida TaxID=116153 RepID=UPI0021499348|nr:uncharacterized protein LOC109604513 isoform X2 [Aethina tumida]